MDLFQNLVGMKAIQVKEVHDYIQIVFDKKQGISIYNSFSLSGGTLIGLVGATVIKVFRSDESISFIFSNNISLTVGLRDEDFFHRKQWFTNAMGKLLFNVGRNKNVISKNRQRKPVRLKEEALGVDHLRLNVYVFV